MNWIKEEIPDFLPNNKLSLLYYRIFEQYIKKDNPTYISPSSFKPSKEDGNMSTNWSKYSNPYQTRLDANFPPEKYGVASLGVKDIRTSPNLERLKIEHAPKPNNRAHTNIYGLTEYRAISKFDLKEVQTHLSRLAKWEINEYLV